jgi:hypothetical protein
MTSRVRACFVVLVAVLGACGTSSDAPDASMRCVSTYSPESLLDRAFAFDGTVVAIRDRADAQAPEHDVVKGLAQFAVHEWFAGRTDESVTVWMQRPVAKGQRLLVSGEPRWGGAPLQDAIAWECGFTAEYSDALAVEWSESFARR